MRKFTTKVQIHREMPTAIGSPILTVHFTVGIRLPIDSDKAVFSCLLEVTNIESVVSNCPVGVIDNKKYSSDCIVIWNLCNISCNTFARLAWGRSFSYKLHSIISLSFAWSARYTVSPNIRLGYSRVNSSSVRKSACTLLDLFDDTLSLEEQRKKIRSVLKGKSLKACAYCNGLCDNSPRFIPAEQLV